MLIRSKAARPVALAALVLFSSVSFAPAAGAMSFTGVVPEEALRGLDAVELSEGHRVEGQGRYTFVFRGLQWRFASEANKRRFKADPDAYIPD